MEEKKISPKEIVGKIGLPTIIIAAFLVFILALGHFMGLSVATLLSDTVKRAGMNGILVLAMLPSIQSGTGPNFALPIGVECGLFGIVCAIEFGFTGWGWFFMSILFSIILATVVGAGYGLRLNAV